MPFPRRAMVIAALATLGWVAVAGCSQPGAAPNDGSAAAGWGAATAAAVAHAQVAMQPADGHSPDGAPTAPPTASTGTITAVGVGSATGTITAVGVGSATGTPDTLTVQLGVQTQAGTAAAALADNNARSNELIATLKGHGVATKDLQTSRLAIYPTYSSSGVTVTGYQLTNSVTATLRDVATAGAVIDAAQQAVGDAIRLSRVEFSFTDDSALRSSARADAVKQALAQAKQMADAANVALGPILSISEQPQYSGSQPIYAADASAAGAMAMPVMSGEQDIAVTVQVVVAIG